jgi:hypothetical protein
MTDKYEERRQEWLRRTGGGGRAERDIVYASEDAAVLAEAAGKLVTAAAGASWYVEPDNDADAAVAALCRLRRASAGQARASEGGDEAVRRVLADADADAVVWIASRAISYMDEQGFPEIVEPWLLRR